MSEERSLTSKEAYEQRKAARAARVAGKSQSDIDSVELLDMVDRFVTAAERLADVLSQPRPLKREVEYNEDGTIRRVMAE